MPGLPPFCTLLVTKNNTMTDQEKTDATLMSVLIMMEIIYHLNMNMMDYIMKIV